VVVVDEDLAPGLAANAAAVVAMTLGARAPGLIGEDYADAAGSVHPGLITKGLPILRAPADELPALRARADAAEVGVIGFPVNGHQTNDYEEFREMLASTAEPGYLGLALYGPAKTIRSLTGSLPLLR
jgi:hypothetical protein